MEPIKVTTILECVSRNPALLALVLEGAKNPHTRYISNLILSSSELVERKKIPWEYKTLQAFGEEAFAKDVSFRALHGMDGRNLNDWHYQAAKSLAFEVTRNILYEDDEGLILYVRDGKKFRPATQGDAPYDFVKRLNSDGNLWDIAIDKPPSWANELFVNKANLEAYALIWHDNSDMSSANYAQSKRAKADAVLRETTRALAGAGVVLGLETEDQYESKPLTTRERDTLLCIIGTLCKEAKLDYTTPAKTAGLIQSTAEKMGISIGETTIEGHLKKVKNALATRMK